MSDSLTPEKRSWNMSRIRSKDTSIEIKVRKYLFSQGFRYKKNVASLPGKPDIVFPKYHAAVFIHGCFWHRHEGCRRSNIPKSKQEYWIPKLEKNVENDIKHYQQLQELGWRPIIVWECELCRSFDITLKKTIQEITDGDYGGGNKV